MQDDLSILLKAQLDVTKSVSNINNQISELQKKIKDLNIAINIDGVEKVFKDMAKEVAKQMGSSKVYDSKDTKKEVEETIKDFKQLQKEKDKLESKGFKGKVSTSFIDVGDGEKLKRVVTEYTDDLKNTIRITENINTETKELVSVEKLVVDNIKKRNDEQEKYARNIELSKQSIGELVAKSRELETGFSGFVDEKDLSKIRRELSAIDVDSEEISSNFKGVNASIQKVGKSLEDVEKRAKKTKESIQLAQIKQSEDNDRAKSKLEYDIDKAHYQALKKNEELKRKAYNEEITQLEYIQKKKQQLNRLDAEINKAKFDKGVDIDYGEILSIQDKLNSFYDEGNTLNKEQKAIVEAMISDLRVKLKLEKDSIEMNDKKIEAQNRANKLINKMDDITVKNDKYDKEVYKELKSDIDKLVVAYQKGGMASNEFGQKMKELEVRAESFGVQSKKLSSNTNTFADSLKRFTAFYGIYDVLQLGKRTISSMVDSIFDLDHALVELQKTSDLTGDSLDGFVKDAYAIGETLARTGTEVISASAEFSKAGYSGSELANLAETALLLTNVGDGISDVADASGTLISAMKGFGIESQNAIGIVDKINAVSNSTASNFEDIAFGLQRMSGTLGMAGASIDETIGMFTAVNEVLRNSEIVSSGLSSVFMRMRGLSEETGESVDGLKAKLEDVFGSVGVSMMDQNGQLRDTFDVLGELSGKWDTLSTNQKQYIATESAGIRQAKVFITLMEQWGTVQDSISTSLNSSGSAMEENEKYLNSLEGKVNNVKSAFEQLAATTINSDLVKWLLDFSANTLKLVDDMGGLIPVLSSIIGLLIVLKSESIITFMQKFSIGTINLSVGFKRAYAAIGLYNKGMITTKALTMSLVPVVGALTIAISGVVMAYNAWKQQEEENSRKLKEKIEKTNEEIKSTQTLISSYENLKDASKSDKESRDRLLQTQKDMVELLGLEKDALDLVNGSYEKNVDIINNANQKKLDQLAIDSKTKVSEDSEKLSQTMKDVSKSNAFNIRSILDGDDYASAKKIAEQMSKEFGDAFNSSFSKNIFGSGGSFSFGVDGNNADEMYNALSRLKELMAESGLTGTRQYSLISQELDKLKTATDTLNASTEQYAKAQNDAMMNVVKTKAGVLDISSATVEQVEAMESLYVTEKIRANGQTYATTAQVEFRNAMAETNPEYAKYIGYTEDAIEEVSTLSEELAKVTKELNIQKQETIQQSENYKLLIDSIEKLNSGQQLSGEEIYNLTSAYKELTPKINETTGEMYLESEALIKLATKQGEDAQQGIMAQINKTKQVAKDTLTRIGLMSKEVMAINSLADAYRVLANNATTATGGYRPVGISDEAWGKSTNMGAGINSIIKDLADLYAEAEKTSSGIDKAFDWNEGLKDSDGSGKGDKPSDKFKLELEKIQAIREDIEYEIALLQEKMNLAELVGDTKTFNELSDKMTVLKDELRGISEIQIGEFEGLAQLYKENEQLGELESLIADARKQGYIDEQEYIRHTIDLLNQRYDIEKRLYDEKLRIINLEQALYEQGTDEYEAMEVQKIDLLVQLQQSYMDKIRALKDEGLRDDNEDIRRYVDMWKDAQEELLSIDLAMQKRRRQAEIDSLKQQQDQLKSISDAKKKILDETIAMIKAEEKARDDAAKKQIKNEIDNMKKLADARKKELQRQKDERRYQKDVDKSNEEISAIQRELDKLMFDNSEWAVAERLKLEQQLKEKTEALEDKQWENKIDKQIDAIDEQVKLFEDQKNYELEIIEKNAMSEVEIRKKALAMMDKKNGELYKKLQKYLEETGKMGKAEFESLWSVANTGLEQFGINTKSTLTSLDAMYVAMKRLADQADRLANSPIGGYKPPSGSGNNVDSKKIQQMIDNSQAWAKATTQAERDRLAKENQRLGAELGLYYNASTGKWYRDAKHTIPAWHTGLSRGQVGTGLKPNELIAKLTEDEWVFTGKQFDNLTNNLKGVIGDKRGNVGDIVLNLYGTITEGAKPLLKEWTKDIEKICYKVVNRTI